jgi:hypothetical protein
MHDLAGDLVGAATTLAGLMLVFLGGLYNSLHGQDAAARASNLPVYRRRAFATFGAFMVAVLSTLIAIIAHAAESAPLTLLSAALLVLVLLWLLVAASFLLQGFR